jgi:hypothetical protein
LVVVSHTPGCMWLRQTMSNQIERGVSRAFVLC